MLPIAPHNPVRLDRPRHPFGSMGRPGSPQDRCHPTTQLVDNVAQIGQAGSIIIGGETRVGCPVLNDLVNKLMGRHLPAVGVNDLYVDAIVTQQIVHAQQMHGLCLLCVGPQRFLGHIGFDQHDLHGASPADARWGSISRRFMPCLAAMPVSFHRSRRIHSTISCM